MQHPGVAVIYDDSLRADTTGGYVLRALSEIVDTFHIAPQDLASVSASDADLFVHIDDGLDYPWPAHLHPSCYWAIDTHVDYVSRLERSRAFDFVFCAQKTGADQMCRDSVNAHWLPLACDPSFHGKQDMEKIHDICMVGSLFPGHPRSDLVQLLKAHFPRIFAGSHPHTELGRIYSSSNIAFNRSLKGDLNMRVFEALCAGTLLLTDQAIANGLCDLFVEDQHLVTYTTPRDLLEKAHYYLAHDDERMRIAEAGRSEVLEKHTYSHRVHEILKTAGIEIFREDGKVKKTKKRSSSTHSNTTTAKAPRKRPTPAALGKPVPERTVPPTSVIRTPDTGRTEHDQYYNWPRPDVLARIPLNVCRVLDVGCGGGRLGVSIKERARSANVPEPIVVGIEVNAAAASLASSHLDAVFQDDIEQLLAESPDKLLEPLRNGEDTGSNAADLRYDCIVLADTLEHLRDADAVLKRMRAILTEDGVLILSVPNIGHHSIMRALADGRWTYEEEGLLDRTHLRFFTRCDLEQTLFRAGYDARRVEPIFTAEYRQWIDRGRPLTLQFGAITLNSPTTSLAEEAFAYQWIVVAHPHPVVDYGLTSIILVTCNQLEYTKACIHSLYRHTTEAYELIFVDNGSTDGTLDYLHSLPGVTIVSNTENLGFPKGCNQGIAEAQGVNIVLLNNDTVLTEGWLTCLLEALYSADDVAAVGPRSHGATGAQGLKGDAPALPSLNRYAWEITRCNRGRRFATGLLIGFCFAIRKSALDSIGLLDERFGVGFFEDNDLSRRLSDAGYRLLCACDAYVYHHVSATFHGEKVDIVAQFRQAHQAYLDKWGSDSLLHVPAPPDFRETASPTEMPPLPENPRISVCIIARNEEHNIADCIDSIREGVDEIIVVDTGSSDRTPEVAAEHGAKVEHFAWCDDFSAARNVSISHATGDWILWMDADDRMPAEFLPRLRELAKPHSSQICGYAFICRFPGPTPEHGVTLVHHLRMFRRHESIRFEYRIHEQILPSLRRAGLQIEFVPIEVVHSGYDWSPKGQDLKRDRDLRLLQLELKERPNHPFALYNLGMTMNALGRWEEAISALHRCFSVSHTSESHLRKAYGLLVNAYLQQHGMSAALQIAHDGLDMFPNDPELLFRAGEILRERGDAEQACMLFERLLERNEGDYCTSVDEGIYGYRTRHSLALVLRELGHYDQSELQLRGCLQQSPHYAPGWVTLAEILIERGATPEALKCVNQLLEYFPWNAEGLALRGQLRMSAGEFAEARKDLSASIMTDPTAVQPRRILAQLLLQTNMLFEAEQVLRAVLMLDPNDASSMHNLATLCSKLERYPEAIGLFRSALARRPDHPGTNYGMAFALRKAGDLEGAAHQQSIAVQLLPGNPQALYDLGDIYLALDNIGGARHCFEQVRNLDASHAGAVSALAMLDSLTNRQDSKS